MSGTEGRTWKTVTSERVAIFLSSLEDIRHHKHYQKRVFTENSVKGCTTLNLHIDAVDILISES